MHLKNDLYLEYIPYILLQLNNMKTKSSCYNGKNI